MVTAVVTDGETEDDLHSRVRFSFTGKFHSEQIDCLFQCDPYLIDINSVLPIKTVCEHLKVKYLINQHYHYNFLSLG